MMMTPRAELLEMPRMKKSWISSTRHHHEPNAEMTAVSAIDDGTSLRLKWYCLAVLLRVEYCFIMSC